MDAYSIQTGIRLDVPAACEPLLKVDEATAGSDPVFFQSTDRSWLSWRLTDMLPSLTAGGGCSLVCPAAFPSTSRASDVAAFRLIFIPSEKPSRNGVSPNASRTSATDLS